MVALLEKTSTVSEKGQTTVPVEVRKLLGVATGDKLAYSIEDDGSVVLRKADGDSDPAIEAFLTFLAADIQRRPDQITGLSESLEVRLRELTAGTRIEREMDHIDGDVGL